MINSLPLVLQTRLKWISLACLWVAMSGIFSYALPHLFVDRTSEFLYMGVPYRMIAERHLRITQSDPFGENGPHAVFLSSAIAYYTHSLSAMRYYHFLFSLAVVGLFFLAFFRRFSETRMRSWEIPVVALLMLSVWITLPLIMVYPIQVNGMTPGVICLIIGLLLEEDHPRCAMMAFGFSYSFKGQFLAMLPGILLYKLCMEAYAGRFLHKGKELLISAILYFVPSTVILTAMAWALGLFNNAEDLFAYAFRAPSILIQELSYIFPVLLHKTAPNPHAAMVRSIEYGGYGYFAWLLIAISVLFCVIFATMAFLARKRPSTDALHVPLSVLAFAGIGYWANYFFFWRYPFWYNTLPMEWFNILIIPLAIYGIKGYLSKRFGPRPAVAFVLLIGLLAGRNLIRRVIVKPVFDPTRQGDSLTPYPWMRS